jgi:hypothetical protein
MTETKKCEFCDKRGLPLLLVREAVTDAGKGAPLSNEAQIELASAAAHYTKRLVRSGYVNVYDEARKRWEAYFVTRDGFYFKLMLLKPGVAPVVPAKPFNCPDQGHSELASCITVSDPKHASTVWIGFSDALWTDAVRRANEDAAYRKRHMVAIDVKAALAGHPSPHSRPIAQLPAVVAEYALTANVAKEALGWGPFQLNLRQDKAKSLVDAFDAMRPGKGLIVTLPDPVGIVQELAALMKHSLERFMDGPQYRRRVAASAAINQIESAIKRQGEISEIDAAEDLANEQIRLNPLGHAFLKSERHATEKIRQVTVPQLTRNANSSWEKYAKKFDNLKKTEWERSFNAKLAAHDKRCIAPLALNHVSWMKSSAMISYFECNYDDSSVQSGLVYTKVVTNCISSTQDKRACSILYGEWLEGSIDDHKNFLLRGMVFNLKKVSDEVKKATEAGNVNNATQVNIDWLKQLPWDNVLAIYTSALKRVSEGAQEISAQLLVVVAGPISRMLGKIIDGTARIRAGFIGLGLVAGHPIVLCEIVGGKQKFREYVVKTLQQTSGENVAKNKMHTAVGKELKRLEVHGAPMDGNTQKRWFIIADKEVLTAMPDGLTPNQKADWMAKSLRTVQQIDDLNLNRWRFVINSGVRFGVVAGLLQAASLTKLIADEEKALANESIDAKMRMYAGMTAVASTTADVLGNLLEKRAIQGLPFGQGLAEGAGIFISRWAGRAAIFAGFLVAALDIAKAVGSFKEEQAGLGYLYIASAVFGAGATVAIASVTLLGAAAIPVIGLLVLLLIGVALIIEYIKDNPVQDWLERCPWGILPDQRYPDIVTEQAQLIQALK